MRKEHTCGLMAVLSLSALAPVGEIHAQKSAKPNVIYILLDDFGYGDAACYGQMKIETPNIDKLAANGIHFTQHYSASPVSAPARCGLYTGLHMGHAQIRGNDAMRSRGNVNSHKAMLENPALEGGYPLKKGTVTLGTVMQDAGYKTAIVGKWGLAYPGSDAMPGMMGFDLFYGYLCQRMAHSYYPPFLWKNDERVYLNNPDIIQPGGKLGKNQDPYDLRSYEKFTQQQYSPDLMYEEIEGFVDSNRNNPFFLVWASTIPHVALQAPKELVDYYVKKFGDEEPYTGGDGYYPCRYPHATYAAMITYLDKQIGDLQERLKQLGIYENTIIMFASDNGPTYNGGSDTPWFKSAEPFRSQKGWIKGSLHEGGVRVPFIVSWPKVIKKARTTDLISYFPDIMPTLCDIVDVECPETDGISLLPTLEGKTRKQQKHEYLYWEYPELGGWIAVRWGDWKSIIRKTREGNDKMELYNLKRDIREEHDVAAAHPDIVAKMRGFMAASHVEPENPTFRLR